METHVSDWGLDLALERFRWSNGRFPVWLELWIKTWAGKWCTLPSANMSCWGGWAVPHSAPWCHHCGGRVLSLASLSCLCLRIYTLKMSPRVTHLHNCQLASSMHHLEAIKRRSNNTINPTRGNRGPKRWLAKDHKYLSQTLVPGAWAFSKSLILLESRGLLTKKEGGTRGGEEA